MAHKNKGKSNRTCRFVGYFPRINDAVRASQKVYNTMKCKETLNAEFKKKEEEKKKIQIDLEALNKLDKDILFTNLREWDYIGNNEFKLVIKDKAGNFHRYNYYENEGKTVWRSVPKNINGVYAPKPVGVLVGNE